MLLLSVKIHIYLVGVSGYFRATIALLQLIIYYALLNVIRIRLCHLNIRDTCINIEFISY